MEINELEYEIVEDVTEIKNTLGDIKEKVFRLNLLNNAQAEYLTEKINGELKGIIIDSETQVNLRISLNNYPNIILYEKNGYTGQKYLSLKNDTTFSNNERAQGNGECWYLNDEIKFEVEGGMNATVKFVVRYE